MHVLVVVGTRPEAIKLAPVIRSLMDHGTVRTRVCLSGQHRELLAQGLEAFSITPDDNLEVMTEQQSVNSIVARVLAGLGDVLQRGKPDWVIVQGDTSTAMAAALAAFHHGIRVAHVEAGLRTGDLSQPWPEEMNRRLIAQMADLHFAPTPGARENLLREGVPEDRIVVTGNTVIDALLLARRMLEQKRAASARPDPGPEAVNDAPMVLVTLHRRENLRADRLAQVEEALVRLSVEEGCRVVFPAHPNPALSGLVQRLRGRHPNLQVIAPQTYVDFIGLLEDASMILSDSGGVQEEAAFLGKPVLIMRDSTERPEVLGAGTGQLVGTDAGTILAAVREILPGLRAGGPSTRGTLAFGTGGAAEMIVRHLMEQETSGLPGGDNVRQ